MPARIPSPHSLASHGKPWNAHDQPSSSAHDSSQPSPASSFPSSQVSVPVILPSPHSTSDTQGSPGVGQPKLASICRQSPVQPSDDSAFPSSQRSKSWFSRPSPQLGSTFEKPAPPSSPGRRSSRRPRCRSRRFRRWSWSRLSRPCQHPQCPGWTDSRHRRSLHSEGGRATRRTALKDRTRATNHLPSRLNPKTENSTAEGNRDRLRISLPFPSERKHTETDSDAPGRLRGAKSNERHARPR